MRDIALRVGESAGADGFALHDMLWTFITSLPDVGAELCVVSQFTGHGSVETTKLYDRRGELAKMGVVERLALGWKGQARAPKWAPGTQACCHGETAQEHRSSPSMAGHG